MPKKQIRINLRTCDLWELHLYVKDREPYVERRELIFAAGALNNTHLREELGGYEQSRWDEGRRAVNKRYKNPYYRE